MKKLAMAFALGALLLGACDKDASKAKPAADKKAPAADKKAPAAEEKAPAAEEKAPAAEEKAPAAEEKAPEAAKPASTLETEEVVYEGGGVKMKGFLAWDGAKEGKRPGVLVVHEWWGHNDFARQRARALAEMGYTALAVDMFGDGKTAGHPGDAMKFTKEVMGNMDTAKARFEAALATLKAHRTVAGDHLAAVGYCFGGGVVLNMARLGVELDGVASFHGSLGADKKAAKGAVKTEVLVAHGAADPLVPPEQVAAFKQEMADAGVKLEFYAYEGAKHAFTNPGADAKAKQFKLPLGYDEKAAKDSWAKLDGFLKRVFAD